MIRRARWLKWGLVLGFWSLASIVYTSHLYFFHTLFGETVTWPREFAEALTDFYSWAALTPLVLYLAGRFPLKRNNWRRSLLVHLPASLLVSLVQVIIHTVADQTLIHGHYSLEIISKEFSLLFARTFHFGLLVYWAIVTFKLAFEYYKDRELRASQMETQLAQAQLQALKMQLHPTSYLIRSTRYPRSSIRMLKGRTR